MTTKSLSFFATTRDIRSVLRDVERELAVQYVAAGDVESVEELSVWSTSADIPDLGVATEGDQALEPALLLLPATEEPQTREVPLRRGGRRILVDQAANAASVMIRAGGVLRSGVLIAGQIGTVSDDSWAGACLRHDCPRGPRCFREDEVVLPWPRGVAPTEVGCPADCESS